MWSVAANQCSVRTIISEHYCSCSQARRACRDERYGAPPPPYKVAPRQSVPGPRLAAKPEGRAFTCALRYRPLPLSREARGARGPTWSCAAPGSGFNSVPLHTHCPATPTKAGDESLGESCEQLRGEGGGAREGIYQAGFRRNYAGNPLREHFEPSTVTILVRTGDRLPDGPRHPMCAQCVHCVPESRGTTWHGTPPLKPGAYSKTAPPGPGPDSAR